MEIKSIAIPPLGCGNGGLDWKVVKPLIENAFKHGVSYQTESFVEFKLEIYDYQLTCFIKNSKHKNKEKFDKNYSGIGLTNIRKSLKLLFNKNYSLNIIENDKEFEVQLTIPVYENKMYSH